MIRVRVTGPPKTGFYPYKIEWYATDRPQFVGVSPTPLLDACRQLEQAGVMDDTVIALFEEGSDQWSERTTVGSGARQHRRQSRVGAAYSDFESQPGVGHHPIAAPTAKSSAAPPTVHIPPVQLIGTGQVPSGPDRPRPPRRKRRLTKSSGRRGSR